MLAVLVLASCGVDARRVTDTEEVAAAPVDAATPPAAPDLAGSDVAGSDEALRDEALREEAPTVEAVAVVEERARDDGEAGTLVAGNLEAGNLKTGTLDAGASETGTPDTGAAAEADLLADLPALAQALEAGGRDARRAEGRLRSALAGGGKRGCLAALVLADHFATNELLDTARLVVEAALRGQGDAADPVDEAPLRAARGRLLRDTAQWDAAATELGRAVDLAPTAPETRVLLAEVEFVRGRPHAALAHLTAVYGTAGTDPWTLRHRARLDGFAAHLRAVCYEGADRVAYPFELLANVRGTTVPLARRRSALEELLATPSQRPAAVLAGIMADQPLLRIETLRALVDEDPDGLTIARAALHDSDFRVRAAAATAAARLGVAPELLLDRLDAEENSYAFQQIHTALRDIAGDRVSQLPRSLSAALEIDESGRVLIRQAWRNSWIR